MAEDQDLTSIFRRVRNAFINKVQAVAPDEQAFFHEWQQFLALPESGPTYAEIVVCAREVDSNLSFFLKHLRIRDALFIFSYYSRQSLPDFLQSRLSREIHTLVIRVRKCHLPKNTLRILG